MQLFALKSLLTLKNCFLLILGVYRVMFCRIGTHAGEVVLMSVCLYLQSCLFGKLNGKNLLFLHMPDVVPNRFYLLGI